jgi:uncharacterized membrane protein
MDDLAIARVLHVLAVVIWIGGVAMVTIVILPTLAAIALPGERLQAFESLERRFAWVARIMTLITGMSGLYLLWKLNLWTRFSDSSFWWMHAMVFVWAIFSFVLFVAEPLFLHRVFAAHVQRDPEGAFRRMQIFHWVLLLISLVTIAGAVAGAHGYSLFGSS